MCVHARTCARIDAHLLLPGDLHDEAGLAVLLVVGQQPAEREADQIVLAELRGARLVQFGDELVELLKLLRRKRKVYEERCCLVRSFCRSRSVTTWRPWSSALRCTRACTHRCRRGARSWSVSTASGCGSGSVGCAVAFGRGSLSGQAGGGRWPVTRRVAGSRPAAPLRPAPLRSCAGWRCGHGAQARGRRTPVVS